MRFIVEKEEFTVTCLEQIFLYTEEFNEDFIAVLLEDNWQELLLCMMSHIHVLHYFFHRPRLIRLIANKSDFTISKLQEMVKINDEDSLSRSSSANPADINCQQVILWLVQNRKKMKHNRISSKILYANCIPKNYLENKIFMHQLACSDAKMLQHFPDKLRNDKIFTKAIGQYHWQAGKYYLTSKEWALLSIQHKGFKAYKNVEKDCYATVEYATENYSLSAILRDNRLTQIIIEHLLSLSLPQLEEELASLKKLKDEHVFSSIQADPRIQRRLGIEWS